MRPFATRFVVGATAALASFAAAGCTSSSSELAQKAKDGRYVELSTELGARVRASRISNALAADVALAVATREVLQADKEASAQRVREVVPCAFALDDALAARMKTPDDAGAIAAETRLADRELSRSDARRYDGAQDAAWRAVAMRAATREGDRALRQKGMLDPAPGIRRAAIHATAEARTTDGGDLEALFDVARLDPEPIVRTDAVRAIARLAVPSVDVTARLRDLWVGADDALREDIATAWASPGVLGAGGRHELLMLFARQTGPAVVAAAGVALASGARGDPELARSATAILARAIARGTERDRLHAIAVSTLGTPALGEAVRAAAKDASSAVRIAALARLTELGSERASAIVELEGLAQSDAAVTRARARFALTAARDARAQAWLIEDLADRDPEVRVSAARGLASLGVAGRAATLLADPDASVRTRVACAVLVAVRGGR